MEIVYPMLFCVVGILILQTAQTGVLTLSLAWAYVALWLTMFIGLISAG
jgi:hypothetical protein